MFPRGATDASQLRSIWSPPTLLPPRFLGADGLPFTGVTTASGLTYPVGVALGKVRLGVAVAVRVCVRVAVGVLVVVRVAVGVAVSVCVGVSVLVGLRVGVPVGVLV